MDTLCSIFSLGDISMMNRERMDLEGLTGATSERSPVPIDFRLLTALTCDWLATVWSSWAKVV